MRLLGYYQYQVFYVQFSLYNQGYVYEIYSTDAPPRWIAGRQECFDSASQAGFAAVGHITLLQKKGGARMLSKLKCLLKGHTFLMQYDFSSRCYHQSKNDQCACCKTTRGHRALA